MAVIIAAKCGGIGPVGFMQSPLLKILFGGDRVIFLGSQIFLGVERGHAAGPRGGDRLTVDLVHHVAAGEHARDAGAGRAGLDLDIAIAVEFELAFEQLGRRRVADRNERAFDVEPRLISPVACCGRPGRPAPPDRRRRRTRRLRCPRSP